GVVEGVEAGGRGGHEGGDVRVEDGWGRRNAANRPGGSRQSARPVAAVSTEQADGAVVEPREDPVAVELQLVKPVVARGRIRDERSELRGEEVRQGSAAGSRKRRNRGVRFVDRWHASEGARTAPSDNLIARRPGGTRSR